MQDTRRGAHKEKETGGTRCGGKETGELTNRSRGNVTPKKSEGGKNRGSNTKGETDGPGEN